MNQPPISFFVVVQLLLCGACSELEPVDAGTQQLRLEGVAPTEVSNAQDVTITLVGTRFVSQSVLILGGRLVSQVSVLNPSVLTAVVPRGTSPGTFDLTVINPDGERAVLSQAITVVRPFSSWPPDAVIPGYTLFAPTGGRSDVLASGAWAGGRWTVMFTRALTTIDPLDDVQFGGLATGATYQFAPAILDNSEGEFNATMFNQNSAASTLGNEASTADVKARRGTSAPAADPADPRWGEAFTRPAGAGILGSATGAALLLRAAFDANNLYLLALWTDATESNLKQSWRFDGTSWLRRPATSHDEDRLSFIWNINVPDFATRGCAALCHEHRMGVDSDAGAGAITADLWHWKASRTNPMGFADDQRFAWGLRDGHLMAYRADDVGTGIESANTRATEVGALPAKQAEGPAGSPAIALMNWLPGGARAVPLATGAYPAGGELPGFTIGAPSGGRSDVRASGSWRDGRWTVLLRRALTNGWRTDDLQLGGLPTGSLYRFSVAVLDNAGGANDATMTSQKTDAFTLGNETSSADLRARGVTSAPSASPDDPSWGPLFTKPAGVGIAGTATGGAVDLHAAYDGSTFYLLAQWSDATQSNLKESWVFDGARWTRRNARGTDDSWATPGANDGQFDEDRLAIFWDISVPDFAARGCAALCHDHRMGVDTDAGAGVVSADLWHWKAARTNPLGFADDQRLAWGLRAGHLMAYRADDLGTGLESPNASTVDGGVTPAFMPEGGGASTFLYRAPPGSRRAVDWQP